MLMKLICHDADEEKALKKRQGLATAVVMLGFVGLMCYFGLVRGSDLPDFAQGFYLGASSAMLLGGIILLARLHRLRTHPEEMKKARIKENDERERTIVNESFRVAGLVTFFVSAAALLVVLPFSRAAFAALLGAMFLYAVSFFVAGAVLGKKI